jgi:hypothetical protein
VRVALQVVSRFFLFFLLLQAAAPTSPQVAGNASPAAPTTPPSIDPAAATFAADVGLLVVTVKPDKTTDYEDVIRALQDALSKATDEKHRSIAKGWRVYKSTEAADKKANVVYVHVIQPTVAGADYRPSLLLDELLAGAPAEMLAKYRDAIAGAPSKLGMTELANMSVAPVPKPANQSPDGPTPPKKPGGL